MRNFKNVYKLIRIQFFLLLIFVFAIKTPCFSGFFKSTEKDKDYYLHWIGKRQSTGIEEKTRVYEILLIKPVIFYMRYTGFAIQVQIFTVHIKLYNILFEIYKDVSPSVATRNSSFSEKKQQEIALLEIKKEIEKKDKEIFKLKKEQKLNNIIIYVVIAAILMVISVNYLIFRTRINKAIREKTNLKKELELKNKELTTKEMHLAKKNELLSNIKNKLCSSIVNLKIENKEIIEEVIFQLNSEVSNNTWSEFEKLFNHTYEDFYRRLIKICPELSVNEKRLCALTKLNLTTKEIATVTHQNPVAIQVARTRLRKKLNIKNIEVSLSTFLSNL